MTRARHAGLAGVLLALCGCARPQDTVKLLAAFSDETVVGELRATWHDAGEEGAGPNATQRKVTYRLDAINQLEEPLYLQLGHLRLIGAGGATGVPVALACALAPGTTAGVVAGAIWVPVSDAQTIRGFEVDRFAVPLSERGRAFYREFLLAQRRGDATAIDKEIAVYASAPPCKAADSP